MASLYADVKTFEVLLKWRLVYKQTMNENTAVMM